MKSLNILSATIITLLLSVTYMQAQENLEYQLPPESILKLANFERIPQVSMDSHKENILFLYRSTYKTLDDLNQQEIGLAGLRLNSATRIGSSMTYINNIKVRKVHNLTEPKQVSGLPKHPRIAYATWAPNEKQIAFTNTVADGVELWVLDVEKAKAKRLTSAILNCSMGNPISWYNDSQSLLVRMIPANPLLL